MAQCPWLQFLFSLIHPSHCCHSPLLKRKIWPDHVSLAICSESFSEFLNPAEYRSSLIATFLCSSPPYSICQALLSPSKVLCLYITGPHENLNKDVYRLKKHIQYTYSFSNTNHNNVNVKLNNYCWLKTVSIEMPGVE